MSRLQAEAADSEGAWHGGDKLQKMRNRLSEENIGRGAFMFGYIAVNKAELKFKEYDVYRSFYCGLCKSLKERGGNLSRLTLSYDMTFLYMLLTGLYEPETVCVSERCMAHPLGKHGVRKNELAAYAADMSVLLSCLKYRDDWKDDRKFSAKCMLGMLAGKNSKVLSLYQEKAERIADAMEQLAKGEAKHASNLDEMAGTFGSIMAEILVYREDEWEPVLSKMGFYLGKFIYIMDAYEDIEEDKKSGSYNPLQRLYQTPDFEGACGQILTMMIAECCREFEKLPILEHADILRNILYSGVWVKYEEIRKKRAGKDK